MVRKIAMLLLALLVGASALPAAADPGVDAGAEQYADAGWVEMHGDRGTFYFAMAWRMVSDSGLLTVGAVGKGTCDREVSRHGEVITCHASGRGKELGPNQFSFHPALHSASMRFKVGGDQQRVEWTGRGRVPHFGGLVGGGDGYVLASAGMVRVARADARILGRHLRTKGWMSFAMLGQEAGAMVFTDYGRELTVGPDGSFDYRVEITRAR